MTVAETIANYSRGGSRDAAAMDEDAFQAIYDRTARPLWAYLLRVSGRRDVADDLVQEAYCRFLVRHPQGMDEAHTRSYLFRIATNLLRDRWRRGEDSGDELLEDRPDEQGVAVHDPAERLDVQRAMRQLKPRERQLLWLAYVEGMSHAEIAGVTGLSALSIRLLLFRARHRAAGLLSTDKTATMVKG